MDKILLGLVVPSSDNLHTPLSPSLLDTLTEVDCCASSPCWHGRCVNGLTGYTCVYGPMYNGQNCSGQYTCSIMFTSISCKIVWEKKSLLKILGKLSVMLIACCGIFTSYMKYQGIRRPFQTNEALTYFNMAVL